MENAYSRNSITEKINELFTNNLSNSDLINWLQELSNCQNFNDNSNNLFLFIFFDYFNVVANNYSPWVTLIISNLKNKIVIQQLSQFLEDNKITEKESPIQQSSSSSSDFIFKDKTEEINPISPEKQQIQALFEKRYKRITKEEYPDVKLPTQGTELLTMIDNMSVPGKVYSMQLELNPNGDVLRVFGITEQKTADCEDDIFQGIMGDLLK